MERDEPANEACQNDKNDTKSSTSFRVVKKETNPIDLVDTRLEEFLTFLVNEYEGKLHTYNMIYDGEIKKAGKMANTFSGSVGQGVGSAVGAALGLFCGAPAPGARVGGSTGKEVGNKVGQLLGGKSQTKKVTKLLELVELFHNDKANFRRNLVYAGFDVFQSFEMQFMRITNDQGPKKAMQLLARDATNRSLHYYQKKKDASLTESFILGDSKVEACLGVPVPTSKAKTAGYELIYSYKSCQDSWLTSSIYEKVGLVLEGKTAREPSSYYERKDGRSRTNKYGYRRLLTTETWSKIQVQYRSSDVVKSGQFTDYKYVLDVKDMERKLKLVLDKVNENDLKLSEERITEIVSEVKDDISEKIKILIKQNRGHADNRKFLEKVNDNINNLRIDLYHDKLNIQRHLVDAKQTYENISNSIKTSRMENQNNFHELRENQNEHFNDNKTEHKKTHVLLEKAIVDIHEIGTTKKTEESIWFNVKSPVELFTGREQELSDLHIKITSSVGKTTVISQITSIGGLGGIGKTELARRYIQKYNKEYENNIIWLSAETKTTLTESFRRLAKDELNITTENADGGEKDIKSIVASVYRFFCSKISLFVFDNADKADYLQQFLPLFSLKPEDRKPYILMTSRNCKWDKGIKVICLNELKLEDAIQLVKNGLNITDESQDDEVHQLVTKLQRFPLAITQAIAYISVQNDKTDYTIGNYLVEYDIKTKILLNSEDFKGIDNDYTKTTLTTWNITIDKIANVNDYGHLAMEILHFIAYLAPDNILNEVLSKLSDDNDKIDSAIRLLVSYSMINAEQKQRILSVHRLVQQVTRIQLEELNENEAVIENTVKILRKSFPFGSESSDDYSKKRQLMHHFESLLSHMHDLLGKIEDKDKFEQDYVEKMLTWMNDGYFASGNTSRQKELLAEKLMIQKKKYDNDDIHIADTLRNLGNICGLLGAPQEQKQLLEETLRIEEKHYGDSHYEIARTLVSMASAYGHLGDFHTKKQLLDRALKIEMDYYGSDHVEVAKTLVNLGNVYNSLGDPQEMVKLLERALEIQEKHLGRDHLDVALTLVNLSRGYYHLGKTQIEVLERALEIQKKHYGNEHFNVAKTLVNLSSAYSEKGDTRKRIEVLELSLKIKQKYYGPDHFENATTLANLANAYGASGDFQKKKDYLEIALEILQKFYGPGYYKIARDLMNLGNAYGELGDHKNKLKYVSQALKLQVTYYGSEHYLVAVTVVNLGIACGDLGDFQTQIEFLERSLRILRKHYGPEHHAVAKTIGSLGVAYGKMGDFSKNIKYLDHALGILKKQYGDTHFEVGIILEHLGIAYGEIKDLETSKKILEEVLLLNINYYGAEHTEVAQTLRNLGEMYSNNGDYGKKKEYLQQALEIQLKHYPDDHFEVVKTRQLMEDDIKIVTEDKKSN